MENSPVTVVVREPSPATIVAESPINVVSVVASGGLRGLPGISGPSISLHAWPLMGEVVKDKVLGLSWFVEEHEEQELIGIGFYLEKGKVKLSWEKNFSVMPGFANIVVSAGQSHILPTPQSLVTWDYINPDVLEIQEKAENLSATLVVRHKII